MQSTKMHVFKAFLCLILVVCILTLTSCTLLSQVFDLLTLENRGYYTDYGISPELTDNYNEETEKKIESALLEMEEILRENNGSKAEYFLDVYDELEENYYILSDHCDLLYIAFCNEPQNEEIVEEYGRISALLTDLLAEIYSFYGDIFESVFSEEFYKDWSQESIEEALFLSKTFSGEFAVITKERDEYVRFYEQLDSDSPDYNKESAEYYQKIVEKNRELAILAGAEDYPDYADRYIYGRDYGDEEIQVFVDAVSEYIIPLGEELQQALYASSNGLSLQTEFNKLQQYDISFDLMKQSLKDYYALLGEEFTASFESFLKHTFTCKDDDSTKGAFTAYQNSSNTPICYFGPGYQSLSTYVHEQGHFTAFYLSETSISSVDLCETHSQGNEWLYLSYAESFYDEELYEELTAYYLLSEISTIVLATCCDTFERTVYADESLSASDYDRVFVDCAKELGAYSLLKNYLGDTPEDYWHIAVISNSMYYLSYAVSLIPSIEFFIIAQQDGFSRAAECYYDLCTVDGEALFHESLLEAGLSSPFENVVFIKIYGFFSKKPVKESF